MEIQGERSKAQNVWTALQVSTRIFWEFFTGFLFIRQYERSVSFFGSARESLPERYYRECEELAARLSNAGFVVITGGSGGIMRSGNKGAYKTQKESVGITIELPKEETQNKFLTSHRNFKFFFSRKTVLACASEVYVFFPGGFGTLDELFEMLTMIQTDHSDHLPVILYGKDFWGPLVAYIEGVLRDTYKTISPKDRDLFTVFDSVDEVEAYISNLTIKPRFCRVGTGKKRL